MRRGQRAGGKVRQQRISMKGTTGLNRHGHRQLAAGPATLAFERALCLSPARKTGPAMKNEAENPIYE
jgi:hypothetical protein